MVCLLLLCGSQAIARNGCPVDLVSAEIGPSVIQITFMTSSTLPIRRLEFSCTIQPRTGKAQSIPCVEENAFFAPDRRYTTNYAFPVKITGPVAVSVKSVTFNDGRTWKPPRRDTCHALQVSPPRK